MNVAALAALSGLVAASTGGWSIVADEDGVQVEQREAGPGAPRAFRAHGAVDAPAAACLAAVQSDQFFARTAPHVVEARVVATEGERVRWFYARLDPPLVAARDYTLRVETEELPGEPEPSFRLSWRTDNARGPSPRPGTIRVERTEGAWTFIPADGGKRTFVRYELVADLGGEIPGWVARRAQLAGIFRGFDELRRTAPEFTQASRPGPAEATARRQDSPR